ncbi:hypothetical protein NMY22_g6723 [Coprinellus aureogranulatus]|nr:hypothetical protein NMY22_g6723 [Coprinellus aureogranulatus]
MPAFAPNGDPSRFQILITGATGYVGQWVLRSVLDRGYHARVVVRSEQKAKALNEVYPGDEDRKKMEFVVIEDLSKEGAFDTAVDGVDGVIHVASTVPSPTEDPEETIRIAKEATTGVLHSALKSGTSINRIVVTSSIGAVWTYQAEPRTFTELDWNEHTLPKYESGQRDPITAYFAAKILSERAVWKFIEDHKDELRWDVSVLIVPFVYGPNLQRVSSPSELLSTSRFWFQSILDGVPAMSEGAIDNGWIDVRDLGEAHVRCLEIEEAGGERIITCAGSYTWGEWFDLVRSVAPAILSEQKANALVKNLPSPMEGELKYKVKYDDTKDRRILGIPYRTKEEMVRGVLEQGVRNGWL